MLYLYHYYESSTGAFNNLSELSIEEAAAIQNQLVGVFAAQRNARYLQRRRYLEEEVRAQFVAKGGKPERKTPYYMVVEECPWLKTWYREAKWIKLPISEFRMETLSFTYGDTFPTFSDKVQDHLEYRKTAYTYAEIEKIIEKYGLPQSKWKEPVFAQPAYVEVQVWSDTPIARYRQK